MKKNIKDLQDTAFNIGYTYGLVNIAKNKGLIVAEKQATKELTRLTYQWENMKRDYIHNYGNTQCPVLKQLVKIFLEDRTKHFNLGLRQCSLNFQPGKFI